MAIPAPERIEEIVRPVLAELGLDVEGVKVVRAGARSQVIVMVDSDQRPDLDLLEAVTEEVSAALDAAEERGEADFGARGYTLEVSTPGVGTPLTRPRHWRRNRGRVVQVTLNQGAPLSGRIGALSPDGDAVILVASSGPKGRPKAIGQLVQLAQVAQAVVQVEFSNPPAVETEFAGLDYDDALTRLEVNK